jgi:NADH-quinone oxidoreductase subunit M
MLTLLLLFIPLLGSGVLLFTKNNSAGLPRNIALIASVINLALIVYVGFTYDAQLPEVFDVNYVWIPELNINFHLGIDGISLLLLALTGVLIPLIVLSTAKYTYEKANNFYALILLTQAALVGVFLAEDIFLFYFFFEAALVPVYFLAAVWGGKNASKVTFKMFVYTIFGSLFMLVALIYLYMQGQTANIQELAVTAKAMSPAVQGFLFWGLFIAFAIKMPIFPLHTWQPAAYTESPTTATMLLGGLLSKMGVYGLIRILLPLSPVGVETFALIGIILAITGLIYGSIIAIQQDNIKRLVAYSSFAHMGLMAAGVLTGSLDGIQGALIQMVAHGINAVGLFFIVKIMYDRTGTRSLSALGGITQKAPALSVYFMIIMLGSVALPLTNGFIGEFLLLKSVYDYNAWLGGIAALTIILGAVYMLRLMQRSMFGEINEATKNFTDVSGTEVAVLLPISIIVILMGIFPNVFLQLTEPAAQAILEMIK